MKVKVQLEGGGGPPRDLLITAAAAATIGDVARHLRLADPTATQPGAVDEDWTLTLSKESRRLLDPRTPLVDSPIRSGALISISPAGRQYASTERAAVAVATILQGPGAGADFDLGSGTNIIGRNRSCEVRLDDPLASRQHARLNVTDHIEIVDLGSANGVELNGSLISREVVRPSDVIQIGDTRLSVRMVQVESTIGRAEAAVGFIRSPRVAARYAGRKFTPPEVPQRTQAQHFPMSMLLMPILMAGIMYVITRQWQTVLFAALSPLMMIGSWWEQRRQGRSVDKAALAAFRADLETLEAEIIAEHEVELSARLAEHPSALECLGAVRERRPLMWTRRPDLPGFLELRLGTGTLPSRCEIAPVESRNGPRELAAEARTQLEPLGTVDGVPVIALPLVNGAIGVAGPRSAAVAGARALVAQAAALHSPAELALCLLASQRAAGDWEWLKWLPHVDAPWSPVEARHLAINPTDSATLVSALNQVIDARSAETSRADAAVHVPAVLVVVESDSPVDFGRLVDLAERGPRAGVCVLWVAPDVEQLPASCHTFVETVSMADSIVGYVHEGRSVTPVTAEVLGAPEAAELAFSLAPVVDLGAANEDSSDLPRAISFLAMDGYEAMADHADAVLERWSQNHSILSGPYAGEPYRKAASLRAAVGYSAGHLLQLDLRADGPHALVGGTTGAGKSELLQSWILSMAANHSPQRLTFLLVDYKGGSAFAECENLPHSVGMVTNLDANGVQRALKSLTAELDHRMQLLQDATPKAKDLMELEKRWDPKAPPSLVIVVDEFAALVQEVPEFVDGVVNVAQRGRSLGLHLILATQRPAGVIKDNLRANTNLRMALRMADEADSSDVLGVPDAALFDPDLPGRAVSKTGAGRLVPFQTAYAGGRTGQGPTRPDVGVEELGLGTRQAWELPERYVPPAPSTSSPTDIARIVSTISAANGLASLPAPRKPWLPDLSAAYELSEVTLGRLSGNELFFAMADDPEHQAQFPVCFEPDRVGNVAILGASGAGKSAAMRSLAAVAGMSFLYGPTWVYGLDFGAQGLAMLSKLPHVGDIIRGSDDERVRRLLSWLRTVVDERAMRYTAADADTVTSYREATGRTDEPRILLLLDGLPAFLKAYEANQTWVDALTSIASAGRPVGVHVVLSADRSGAMPTQLAATVQSSLVLRMTSADDYDNCGVPRTMLTSSSPAGRGIWGSREVQVAILGGSGDLGSQSRSVLDLTEGMRSAGAPVAPPVRKLPELIRLDELAGPPPGEMAIGIRDDTMGALSIVPEGTLAITGPPGAGRTTAIATIVSSWRRANAGGRAVLFTMDRRSPLLDLPWQAKALVPEEADLLAAEWSSQLSNELRNPVLLVVEKLADWSDSVADPSLETMMRAAARAGAFVVSDGEPMIYGRSYGLGAAANTSKVGFMLQPDPGDGAAFGGDLPRRINRADFPPGRGFLLRRGVSTLAQLAIQ